MVIQFQCPQCAKGYQLPDEMAGKTAKCGCGAQIAVPAAQPVVDPLAAPVAADPLADPLAAPIAADPLAAPVHNPVATQQQVSAAGPWTGASEQAAAPPETEAVAGGSGTPPWVNAVFGKTIAVRITRGVLVTIMLALLVVWLMERGTKGNWNAAHERLESAGTMAKADVRKMMTEEYGAEMKEGMRDQFRFGGILKKYWIEVSYSTLNGLPEGTVALVSGKEVTIEAQFDASSLLQKNFGSEYPSVIPVAGRNQANIPQMDDDANTTLPVEEEEMRKLAPRPTDTEEE